MTEEKDIFYAPFPYFGGKRRWVDDVWQRFGKPNVYVEPFFGSGAILLGNPNPAPKEVVYDLSGHICNVWRAIRSDPEAVTYWANWPPIHQDLTARHAWLTQWGDDNNEKLMADPDFCDAKAAGWWVWGAQLWIGSGWCSSKKEQRPRVEGKDYSFQRKRQRIDDKSYSFQEKRPSIDPRGGHSKDTRPHVDKKGYSFRDQIPHIGSMTYYDHHAKPGNLESITAGTLENLSARLRDVSVVCRSWKDNLLSRTILSETADCPEDLVRCIFMDPPYLLGPRDKGLYDSDNENNADETPRSAYRWAVKHGERYRIAYACHEGDFPVPEGWKVVTKAFVGMRRKAEGRPKDLVMFSPACLDPDEAESVPVRNQLDLFA